MISTLFISGADKGLGFSLARRFLQTGIQVFAGQYDSNSSFISLAASFPQKLFPIPAG